jgi:hypothetical protein
LSKWNAVLIPATFNDNNIVTISYIAMIDAHIRGGVCMGLELY